MPTATSYRSGALATVESAVGSVPSFAPFASVVSVVIELSGGLRGRRCQQGIENPFALGPRQ